MTKLYYTEQYKRDLLRIYKISLRDFGYDTAMKTMRQIKEVEKNLREDRPAGKIDPQHHSARFHFTSIRNSQKIFYERTDDCVFMITAGYAARDWKNLLHGLEDYADQQIALNKK